MPPEDIEVIEDVSDERQKPRMTESMMHAMVEAGMRPRAVMWAWATEVPRIVPFGWHTVERFHN